MSSTNKMSNEQYIDYVREELLKSQRMCVYLQLENLLKEVTIRKLTAELKGLPSIKASQAIGQEMLDAMSRRRADALERHRIEYEYRIGTSNAIELSDVTNEGFDEIDE